MAVAFPFHEAWNLLACVRPTPRRCISQPTNNIIDRAQWKRSHSVPSGGHSEIHTRFLAIICPSYARGTSIKIAPKYNRYPSSSESVADICCQTAGIVTFEPWLLKYWPTTIYCSHVTISRFQAHDKENTKSHRTGPFVRKAHWLLVYSRHKLAVMWRMILYHDLIMYIRNDEWQTTANARDSLICIIYVLHTMLNLLRHSYRYVKLCFGWLWFNKIYSKWDSLVRTPVGWYLINRIGIKATDDPDPGA